MRVFDGLSAPVRGALWMSLYAAIYSVMMGVARHLSEHFTAFEIVFFRAGVGLLLMAPWALGRGVEVFRTARLPMHIQRVGFSYLAQASWFWGIALIPLATAVALQFTLPILVMLGAALFLGEHVGRARWATAVAGFIGVIVILRPGLTLIELGAFAVLFSALSYAGANLSIKSLSRTETTDALVLYVNLLMLPIAIVPVALEWSGIRIVDLPWIALLGLLGVLANICTARSYSAADASLVTPFDFLRLPCSATIGILFFAQPVEIWTWLGAAIIVAAVYILTLQERSRARTRAAP